MANSSSVRPYSPKKKIKRDSLTQITAKYTGKSWTSIAYMVGRSLTWKPDDDGIFLKWKKKWDDLLNETFWDQKIIREKKANAASPFGSFYSPSWCFVSIHFFSVRCWSRFVFAQANRLGFSARSFFSFFSGLFADLVRFFGFVYFCSCWFLGLCNFLFRFVFCFDSFFVSVRFSILFVCFLWLAGGRVLFLFAFVEARFLFRSFFWVWFLFRVVVCFDRFFFVLVVSRLGRLGAWFSLRFGLVWIRYFRLFGFGMCVGSVFVLSRSVVWIDSVISAVRCVVSVSFFRLLDFVWWLDFRLSGVFALIRFCVFVSFFFRFVFCFGPFRISPCISFRGGSVLCLFRCVCNGVSIFFWWIGFCLGSIFV